jgi:hypothetical protein
MTKTRDLANLGSGFTRPASTFIRRVSNKLGDEVSIKDFGVSVSAEDDDSAALVSAFSVNDTVIIDAVVHVKSNISISSSKRIVFKGGYLEVAAGVEITLDALIVSPEEWIFRGEGSVVTTNYYNNAFPNDKANPNSVIYAKWFGVLNDVVYDTFYSPQGIPSFSWTFGNPPTKGTDSTKAMKAALLYCQLAQKKGSSADRATGGPELMLPAGHIYVKGNNPFGSQLFRSELEAAYAAASSGTLTPLSSEIKFSQHDIRVTGQKTVVIWKPDLTSDKFIWAFHTCFGSYQKDYTMHYIVPENQVMGTYFYNLSYGLRGTGSGFTNSLQDIFFEGVQVLGSSNGGRSQLTTKVRAAINKIIHLEGNVKADKVTTRDCAFSGFITGVSCENFDSVLHNYTTTWFAPCDFPFRPGGPLPAVVFDYPALSGNVFVNSCYFDLKASNITFLNVPFRTDLYTGNSSHATPTFHINAGNRLEGFNGGTNLVLFKADVNCRAIFDGLNVAYGGVHTASFDAIISKGAQAEFKNGTYHGSYIIEPDPTNRDPAITYETCGFTFGGLANGFFPTENYFNAAVQGSLSFVPAVKYIGFNSPEKYGSSPRQVQSLTEVPIGERVLSGGVAKFFIGQPGTNTVSSQHTLPPLIVAEEVLLSLDSHSLATFDQVELDFFNSYGSYKLLVPLSGVKVSRLSILPANQWLSSGNRATMGDSPRLKVLFKKSGVPLPTFSYSGKIVIKCRPIQSGLDVSSLVSFQPHLIDAH